MRPYFLLICMETGKSSANSGGKKSSACFLVKGVWPAGGAPSSITWSLETSCPLTIDFCAKEMRVEGAVLEPTFMEAKAAAWASRAWLRP